MTSAPHSIDHNQPLELAEKLMREKKIRHLPVFNGKKIVGILTSRNVRSALMVKDAAFSAEDAMIPDLFVVNSNERLDVVAAAMAEEKYGCAIVHDDNGKLAGIFTTVDACRALRQILETAFED